VVRAEAAANALQRKLTDAQQRVYREIRARVPAVETKVQDLVEAEMSEFFGSMQSALEVLIESQMDVSLDSFVGAAKAIGAKFSERYRLNLSNEVVREFRRLFPDRMDEVLRDSITRKAVRLLEAEWQTAATAALGDLGANIDLGPVLREITRHVIDVTVKALATVASAVALLFIPGGAFFDAIALLATGRLLRGAVSKTAARTERAKTIMRVQLRNQRKILIAEICPHLFGINQDTAAAVERKMLERQPAWEAGMAKAFGDAERARGWNRLLEALLRTVEDFDVEMAA
jgi:hypothetical protein